MSVQDVRLTNYDYGKYSSINNNLVQDIENEVIDTQLIVEPKTDDSIIKSPAKKRVFVDTDNACIKTRSRTQAKINIAFEQLKNDIVEPPKVPVKNELTVDTCESDKESNRSFDFENEDLFTVEQDSNDFPARDSDNDCWPATETINKIPKKVIENGILLFKGKRLMNMISIFFKLECDLCPNNLRFRKLTDLFEHYSSIHKIEGYVMCCQTKLSRFPSIVMHFAKHIQPEAFQCNICGYMVSRPKFLQRHQQTHLPESEKPLACDKCEKKFCWKGALSNHLINHQPVESRKSFVCHLCGRSYQNAGSLCSHKKLAHSEPKEKVTQFCELCAKSFSTRTGLKEHMLTHNDDREKQQLQCKICLKWLMNQRCLKTHMLLHSSKEFNCEHCDYATKKIKLLNNHMITKHSENKPFKCPDCEKSFKLKRALTIHVNQNHTGRVMSFVCEFCQRSFQNSTNYYTHRKNIHPLELKQLNDKKKEEQQMKRIHAGIERENPRKITIARKVHGKTVIEDAVIVSTGDIVNSSFIETQIDDKPLIISVTADSIQFT
ncbi:unnamed protein product [Diamesa serratosioi]